MSIESSPSCQNFPFLDWRIERWLDIAPGIHFVSASWETSWPAHFRMTFSPPSTSLKHYQALIIIIFMCIKMELLFLLLFASRPDLGERKGKNVTEHYRCVDDVLLHAYDFALINLIMFYVVPASYQNCRYPLMNA